MFVNRRLANLVFFYLFMKVPHRITDVTCITQVTWKIIDSTLFVNDSWFSFFWLQFSLIFFTYEGCISLISLNWSLIWFSTLFEQRWSLKGKLILTVLSVAPVRVSDGSLVFESMRGLMVDWIRCSGYFNFKNIVSRQSHLCKLLLMKCYHGDDIRYARFSIVTTRLSL